MNFYLFRTPNGQEYKFRLRSIDQVALFKELGYGALDGIELIKHGDYAEFISKLMWRSAQAFEHGFTLDKAYELIDGLVESGWDMGNFLLLATEILSVSGFFPKERMEAARAEIQKITAES